MTKNCKFCGFLDPTQQVCQLTRVKVDPQNDFCSKFLSPQNLIECQICGNPTINSIWDTEFEMEICYNCAKNLHKCPTCELNDKCDFNNDPDPMPKVVLKTIQNQMGYIQTQIANPERIQKFCTNCKCFNSEHGCLKQEGFSCENWKPLTVILYHKK